MKLKLLPLALIALTLNTANAQSVFDFASTGQQKLLINPALCASEGFHVQTLGAYEPVGAAKIFANYTGVSFSAKNFAFGISNTLGTTKVNYSPYSESYKWLTNETSLSFAYKVNITSRITLVPSVQGSFYTYHNNITGSYSYSYTSSGFNVSPGVLVDINKMLTFGVALYNAGSDNMLAQTQVYHASLLLFKEKTINFQPYVVFKRTTTTNNYDHNQFEAGAFTSYRFVSLQTAFRADSYNRLTLGLNFNFSFFKFGYTFSDAFNYSKQHELYVAISPFKNAKNAQRPLLLN